jgi:hypothetical protein
MVANDPKRFIVRLEVFAASGPIDLEDDADKSPGRQMREVIHSLQTADPDEIEDQTYRLLRFDLCDACRRHVLARPLGQRLPADPAPGEPAS